MCSWIVFIVKKALIVTDEALSGILTYYYAKFSSEKKNNYYTAQLNSLIFIKAVPKPFRLCVEMHTHLVFTVCTLVDVQSPASMSALCILKSKV